MSDARRLHRYTYADYVALEMDSSTKHEFLDGEIYAMPGGGSEEHSALDVESVGLATFPDGSVICGPLQQHEPSPNATAVNPMILIEVTSDSSEEYDAGAKLEYYKTISTLREYVIASHRERRLTVHSRASDGGWTTRVVTKGSSIEVASLGAHLNVDEIYRHSSVQ